MTATPLTPLARAFAPDFARRFAMITASLIALMAREFLRDPRLARFTLPLFRRLNRAARICNARMATLAAGRFPRPAAKPRDAAADDAAAAPRKPDLRTPTTALWLIKTLRHKGAAHASQLAYLLAEPAVPDLLAGAPTTLRFLRPLCRMLGVQIPALPVPQAPPPQAPPPEAPPPQAPITEPVAAAPIQPAPAQPPPPRQPRQSPQCDGLWRPERPPWNPHAPLDPDFAAVNLPGFGNRREKPA